MKILVVSQHFYPESFRINDWALSLHKMGHEVTVLTGLPNYPKGELFSGYSFLGGPYTEDWQGIKIVRTPIITRGHYKGIRLVANYFSFALIGIIVGFLRLHKDFDRIFIYQTSPVLMSIPGVVIGRLYKIPIDFWVQDLWPQTLVAMGQLKEGGRLYGLWERFIGYLYSKCDRVLVTSLMIQKTLQQKFPSCSVHYFPNWAEDLFLEPLEKMSPLPVEIQKQWPKSGFCVLFAGNIGLAQDFGNLIDAASLLDDHNDIHFVIAGDGSAKIEVLKEIRLRELQDRFTFIGNHPLEVMPSLFAQSDALLVSLKKDPLFAMTAPSKIQPYMASGKPIIAALDGEGAEIVAFRSRCGIAPGASNPRALADALVKLKTMDQNDRDQLGKNARNYYFEHFDKNKVLDAFVRLES
jgi:colanic acid biosynthesis glycosyl transferase WcaI